jgi:hypothetical protein
VGLRIFVHAVELVFSHIGAALRISAVLYLVPAILYQFVLTTVISSGPNPLAALQVVTLVFAIVGGLAALWIAVAWHRYVLLDESPGSTMPPFHGDRLLAYFGNSFIIGLIAFGLGLVIFMPLGFVAAGIAKGGGAVNYLILLVPLVGYFAIAAFIYRISHILPASAIGKPIKLSEAWAATSGTNVTIFVLALISVLCVLLLGLPVLWIRPNLGVLAGFLWQTVIGWIELMVAISIITTLYGHYIERRPLAQ